MAPNRVQPVEISHTPESLLYSVIFVTVACVWQSNVQNCWNLYKEVSVVSYFLFFFQEFLSSQCSQKCP